MALAASREIAVASVDRRFRAEFVEQVLLNRLDEAEVRRRCQALDWRVAYPAVVACLSPATLDATSQLERARDVFGWELRAMNLHAPHAIISGSVIAIIGVANGDPESIATSAVGEVLARCVSGAWSAGISNTIESPEELPRAWDQAAVATRVTQTVRGPGLVGRFADLGVYRLLSEFDGERLEGFAREALGELYEPVGGHVELRRTLKVLLETNMNVAQTAREMHYHYNSVRYRTAQLEKVLGPFVDNSTRRLELHVAMLICEMIQGESRPSRSVSG
jgi:purine catabolism regulator